MPARRPSLLMTALLGPLVIAAACSGGSAIDDAVVDEATTTTLAFEPEPTTTVAPRPPRPRTCDALEEVALRLGTAVQVLAQLRSVDQYNLVKQGAVALDPSQVLADIDDLRVLQRTAIAEEHGTVRAALDTYASAARLARTNLAVDDPFAEGGKGPELVALIQDVRGFLRGQVAIGVALDTLGCS